MEMIHPGKQVYQEHQLRYGDHGESRSIHMSMG